MTKVNSIINPPPTKAIDNPFTHYVKPVLKVKIDESGASKVIYTEGKPETYTNINICCNNDIRGKARDEILREELQLIYEAWVVTDTLRKQNRCDEEAAIFIDVAKRSEELALKYASLYQGDLNKKLALKFMYINHTDTHYGYAVNCLMSIIEDPKYTNKRQLANMLLYAHGKLLSIAILMQDDVFIKSAKKLGKRIDEQLVSMGLGDLIEKHAIIENIESKQDTFLPSFTPLATLGGMVSRMFSANQAEQDSEGSDASTEIKFTNKNKKLID